MLVVSKLLTEFWLFGALYDPNLTGDIGATVTAIKAVPYRSGQKTKRR
jgi:hypothetical protein